MYADMGSEVAPAIDSLARKFLRALENPGEMPWPLSASFAGLHFCKCATRAFRRYVLTDGTDTFGLSDIHAVMCSDSKLGRLLCTIVPQAAIAFTDRHNDQYSYTVVSPPVIEAFTEHLVKPRIRVKTSIFPEFYLYPLKSAKAQPAPGEVEFTSIVVNSHGHLLVSDARACVVRVFFNRIPEKSKILAGKEGKQGEVEQKTSPTDPCFTAPAGIEIWEHEDKEDLLVCDAGSKHVVCVTNIKKLTSNKRNISKVSVNCDLERNFIPWAITRQKGSFFFVSNIHAAANCVLLMEITIQRSKLMFSTLQTFQLHTCAWGLAFHPSVGLAIATGGSAEIINVGNNSRQRLLEAVEAVDVTFFMDSERLLLAVVDHGSHTVKLLNPVTGGLEETWGKEGHPGVEDGPIDCCKFRYPTALAAIPGGRTVFVASLNQICRTSLMDFGVSLMGAVLLVYEAICFVPDGCSPAEANLIRQSTLEVTARKYSESSGFFLKIVKCRFQVVQHRVQVQE